MAAPVVGVMRWNMHVDGLTAEHAGIAHQRIRENQGRLGITVADLDTAVKPGLPHALGPGGGCEQAAQAEQQYGAKVFHAGFLEDMSE